VAFAFAAEVLEPRPQPSTEIEGESLTVTLPESAEPHDLPSAILEDTGWMVLLSLGLIFLGGLAIGEMKRPSQTTSDPAMQVRVAHEKEQERLRLVRERIEAREAERDAITQQEKQRVRQQQAKLHAAAKAEEGRRRRDVQVKWLQQQEAAIAEAQHGCALDTKSTAEAALQGAHAHTDAGRCEEALEAFAQAVSSSSGLQLGLICCAMGSIQQHLHLPEAEGCYRDALHILSHHPLGAFARLGIAVLLLQKGDTQGAADHATHIGSAACDLIQRYLVDHPGDDMVRQNYAKLICVYGQKANPHSSMKCAGVDL